MRIEKMGGKIAFDGADWRVKDLSLSRAFVDIDCTPYVTHLPQIYKHKLSSKDKFVILACDGLWDVVSNQDAIDFIQDLLNKNFKGNFSKMLCEYALAKGSMDNVSIIIYFL
jgi:serine/threonine protein phosphatase PrpC